MPLWFKYVSSALSLKTLHWSVFLTVAFDSHLKRKRIPKGILSFLEQMMGIEPTRSAWKAEVLPLNYICIRAKYILNCKYYFITYFAICQILLKIIVIDAINLLIIDINIRNHNWWNTAVCSDCCDKSFYIREKRLECVCMNTLFCFAIVKAEYS